MRNLIILNQNFPTNPKIDVARPQNVIFMQILDKFIMADILRNNREIKNGFYLTIFEDIHLATRKRFMAIKLNL